MSLQTNFFFIPIDEWAGELSTFCRSCTNIPTVCVDVMGLNEHVDKKLCDCSDKPRTRAVAFLLDIRLQVLSTPISVRVSACVMSS